MASASPTTTNSTTDTPTEHSSYVSSLLAGLSYSELLQTLEQAEAATAAKKTELSLVVSTRYPALLDAADSCEEMLELSKSIETTLSSFALLLRSIQSPPAPAPPSPPVEPDIISEFGRLVGIVTCGNDLNSIGE